MATRTLLLITASLLLQATPLCAQSASEARLEQAELGFSIGLQDVNGQVRLSWRAEGLLHWWRIGFGGFTSHSLPAANRQESLDLHLQGLLVRYHQPIWPILSAYGGVGIGWGDLTVAASSDLSMEGQVIDQLRTESLEAGLQVHLSPRLTIESGSSWSWLHLPGDSPIRFDLASDSLYTFLGLRWRFLRDAPDKSQPAN